ncbi:MULTISPECIES: FmdB family zinc ribbon protein [Rothia]|uniref:FmdB family transcriptional regulator n=1 Tax=Rothia nasimurium TaxID=85336 RepID=A0A1Y1RSC8_9MICC|nr:MULTISPECIES: FmdB family zinc ribbon protein [Rothia]ORC24494.1 FmdB family transcriptional regulator [Rothia nasimurium]
MPVYVYQCKNCGYVFEQRQSLSEEALTTCPQCSQGTLRKKFGQVGVVFKGSGFYANDKGK